MESGNDEIKDQSRVISDLRFQRRGKASMLGLRVDRGDHLGWGYTVGRSKQAPLREKAKAKSTATEI
jgi:hypothetical protein